MRLIDVHSFLIKDFIGDDTPPYAILSHTWGPEEVTLKDMQAEFGDDEEQYPPNASSRTRASRKKGFLKIKYTCKQAAEDGLKWAWVDTCCIDKTSSAELSEAINSMYRWYNQAKICYAYLVDVTLDSDSGGSESLPARGLTLLDEAVSGSRWLTRGFTLQELLAPGDIVFYNAQWTDIGSRNGKLRNALAFATRIDYKCLGSGDHARLAEYSIATRMSWASHRSCTRTEDVAYCLMGIFDVNMPMLYGEGNRAFIRLQEEIFKESEDDSLFAWAVAEDSDRAWCPSSIFAESPVDFARSGAIEPLPPSRRGLSSITKLGISIELGQSTLEKPIKRSLVIYDHEDVRRVYISKNLSPRERHRFLYGTIYLKAASNKDLPQVKVAGPDFSTIKIKDSSTTDSHVDILVDPWAIIDAVTWCQIEFEGYFIVSIGIGANIIYCYANMIEPGLAFSKGVSVYDKPHNPWTTCTDYRKRQGLLVLDEVTTDDGETWRVELFHDLLPSKAHTNVKRLHLLLIISAPYATPSPDQQQQ